MSFPLSAPTLPDHPTGPTAAGHRVLYIEDDIGQTRLMERTLTRQGYSVESAANGLDGLALFDGAGPFDLVLIDYSLPAMDGLEVLGRIVEGESSPPCIMITGQGNEYVAVQAMKMGAYDYIVKDFNTFYLQLMPTMIERALRMASQNQEIRQAQQALRESEARFHKLADAVPVQIWVADTDRLLQFANQHLLQFLGTPGLHPGSDLMDRPIHQEDLLEYQATLDQAFARHQPYTFRYRMRDDSGGWHWLNETGIPRFSDGAEFAGFMATAIDVGDAQRLTGEVEGLQHQLNRLQRQVQALLGPMKICRGCRRVQLADGSWLELDAVIQLPPSAPEDALCADCA